MVCKSLNFRIETIYNLFHFFVGVNYVRTIGVNSDREFHVELAKAPCVRMLTTECGGKARVNNGMKASIAGIQPDGRYRVKLGDNVILDVCEQDLKKATVRQHLPAFTKGENVQVIFENDPCRAMLADDDDVQVVFTGEVAYRKHWI